MRVFSRFALVVLVLVVAVPSLIADHLVADCPLTLVATNPPSSDFNLSPHGVFRFGSQVFALRGQTLTTYAVTDLGDMQVAREDFIGSLGARETNAGVAFNNGFLFVSSEAGLEIFDLRNVRAGGLAPVLVSRTPGAHYRRLAVSGNTLAGLFPGTDLPCWPNNTTFCYNTIDLWNISNMTAPTRVAQISSIGSTVNARAFNDIAFMSGQLIATSYNGTYAYNISTPASPFLTFAANKSGTFLVAGGAGTIGVGDDNSIVIHSFSTATGFTPAFTYTVPPSLTIDRANPIMFHPQAWIDETAGRLITMIDERDPLTRQPARTIAFAVYDWGVFQYEGFDPRLYEAVTTMINPDEVKYNPIAVGAFVYTIGELSGLQTWGACGQMTGRIEWDGTQALPCGGAEIHGWVTGTQKIANVELMLDGGSLGAATLGGPPRHDVSSRTPVSMWRINVNLDQTTRGEHLFRLIATDSVGNRRQVATQKVFFPGPPNNCASRRRQAAAR
ncbi:MAG TPA: hypothetical protein VNL91_02130 [Thermoanaerobaculia bacterium]|nr:hypothetical protein [Thermoanaerobaculia bacterium]